MYIEPNTSVEIQDFLAVTAQYLGIEADVEVARHDRVFAPFFGYLAADRLAQRDESIEQRYA